MAWLALALFFFASPARVRAQASPQIIGSIEGDDFAVDGSAGGAASAIQAATNQLVSGAHVTVKTGQVRVSFNSGGGIAICAPARFQLLASGDALTVVLEYGEIDLHLDSSRNVTVFTPLIVATPVSVGEGSRETIVGLARSGDMCLRATRGAARVEQQLSGQSLLVPQFGEVSLSGGQVMGLKSPEGACGCSVDEALLTKPKPTPTQAAAPEVAPVVTRETVGALGPVRKRVTPPVAPQPVAAPAEQAPPQIGVSAPSTPSVSAQGTPPPPEPEKTSPSVPPVQRSMPPPVAPVETSQPQKELPETGSPIYKVLVPALTFDASSPAPPPNPSPDTILLVRSVRVQQDLIYTDKVEAKGGTKAATSNNSASPKDESKPPSRGFFASVGRFFRRIFG